MRPAANLWQIAVRLRQSPHRLARIRSCSAPPPQAGEENRRCDAHLSSPACLRGGGPAKPKGRSRDGGGPPRLIANEFRRQDFFFERCWLPSACTTLVMSTNVISAPAIRLV